MYDYHLMQAMVAILFILCAVDALSTFWLLRYFPRRYSEANGIMGKAMLALGTWQALLALRIPMLVMGLLVAAPQTAFKLGAPTALLVYLANTVGPNAWVVPLLINVAVVLHNMEYVARELREEGKL